MKKPRLESTKNQAERTMGEVIRNPTKNMAPNGSQIPDPSEWPGGVRNLGDDSNESVVKAHNLQSKPKGGDE